MSMSIENLAFFGGTPSFSETLHVGRPNIGNPDRMVQRLREILERRWLSNHGPVVTEFEKQLSDLTETKHCIALCNGTISLEIAIRALGMTGEVILPSWTFVATAHALQWQEITPVFCDVDPRTHNLDPQRVASLITPRTSGIIGVHLWGRGCAVDELEDLARQRNLKLLFDAAHAFGCSQRGRPIGSSGNAEVFSFHATKFLNTFEGGAIATNDDQLANRIRLMTNFGFAGYDRVKHIGTNGKMTEIAAAMGLTSLESMQGFVAANATNWKHYKKELTGIRGLKLLEYDDRERCNFQYVVLEVDPKECGLHRDWLIEVLHAENVMARRYFYPGVHRMEPYRSYFPHAGMLLPATETLAQSVLVLPTGTAIGATEIGKICRIIKLCVEHRVTLNQLLANRSRRVTPDLL